MREKNGPVVHNFVHTETQDGKSLLDAHFAHATAFIKRFLSLHQVSLPMRSLRAKDYKTVAFS
jgi:hypothetical protein